MTEQKVITVKDKYTELDDYITVNRIHTVFLVCDLSMKFLKIRTYFETVEDRLGIRVVRYDDFTPNPKYESVVTGIRAFLEKQCDAIFAVGGGSAMDVAKCIKLYSNMDQTKNYLEQEVVPNNVKFLAVPTTAGTGSEATRYAVVYYNGEKQSVTHESIIPDTVVFDTSALETLPLYQKKATMMDAFCHAVESYWSVNSTEESREYSGQALKLIMENRKRYLEGDHTVNILMFEASNLAGKAINITQTTAGHAMCYKLTSLYGISHGHAAVLCVAALWEYMDRHLEKCCDVRGREYVNHVFKKLAAYLGCSSVPAAVELIQGMIWEMELSVPEVKAGEYDILAASVNPVRLKNNPVVLDEEAVREIYHTLFEENR